MIVLTDSAVEAVKTAISKASDLPAGLRTSLLRVTVMDRRPVGLWGARTPTTECDELGDLILLTNQGANR